MMRQLGEQIGQLVAELHRDHSVRLCTRAGVNNLLGHTTVTGVQLTTGEIVQADTVVIAVGSTPATTWLATSGLPLDDGILCDSTCPAVPNIYAAGDVARWHNPRFGIHMRVEHWMNATEQGLAVARNLLCRPIPFDPLPYFWTELYDIRIQAYGILAPTSTAAIVQGDPTRRRFTARFIHDGRIAGVLGWNTPKQLHAERNLVGQPNPT